MSSTAGAPSAPADPSASRPAKAPPGIAALIAPPSADAVPEAPLRLVLGLATSASPAQAPDGPRIPLGNWRARLSLEPSSSTSPPEDCPWGDSDDEDADAFGDLADEPPGAAARAHTSWTTSLVSWPSRRARDDLDESDPGWGLAAGFRDGSVWLMRPSRLQSGSSPAPLVPAPVSSPSSVRPLMAGTPRSRINSLHNQSQVERRASVVSITSSPARAYVSGPAAGMSARPFASPSEPFSPPMRSLHVYHSTEDLRSVALSGSGTPTTGFAPVPSPASAVSTKVDVDVPDPVSPTTIQTTAETLLEQQYHAGEGALTSMLGHLAGKHKHQHTRTATPGHPRLPSHAQLAHQQHAHPLRPSPSRSMMADPPRSEVTSPTSVAPASKSPHPAPAVPLELVPVAQLVHADDSSPVTSLVVALVPGHAFDGLAPEDIPPSESVLIALKSSGSVTSWSSSDGRQLGHLQLNRSKAYAPAFAAARVPETSNEGGFFTPLVAQGLAALRSRASSPAPSASKADRADPSQPLGSSLSVPGSPKRAESQPRLGRAASHSNLASLANGPPPPQPAAGEDASPEWVEQDRLLQCNFKEVRVLDLDEGKAPPTLVAFDDLRKKAVLLSLLSDGALHVEGHITYPAGISTHSQIAVLPTSVSAPQPLRPSPGFLTPTSSGSPSPVPQPAIRFLALLSGKLWERVVMPNGAPVPHLSPVWKPPGPTANKPALPRHVLPSASAPGNLLHPATGEADPDWTELHILTVDVGGKRQPAQGLFSLGSQLVAWHSGGLGLFALCDRTFSQVESVQLVAHPILGLEAQPCLSGTVLRLETHHGLKWATVSHDSTAAWKVDTAVTPPGVVALHPFPVRGGTPLTDHVAAVVEGEQLSVCAVHKIVGQSLPLYRAVPATQVHELVVPLSLDHLFIVHPSGSIRTSTAQSLARAGAQLRPGGHNSFTAVKIVLQPMARRKLILAGTVQGDLLLWSVWNAQEPGLLNKFNVLDTAVTHIVPFLPPNPPERYDTSHALHDLVACVGADGTVALVQIETFQVSLLVPGRGVPLSVLAAQAFTLLLIYADESARIWDLRTQELRQCVPAARAYALLDHPEVNSRAMPGPALPQALAKEHQASPVLVPWTVHDLRDDARGTSLKIKTGILTVPDRLPPVGARPVLEADLRKAIDAAHKALAKSVQAAAHPPALGSNTAPIMCPISSPAAKKALTVLSPFLAALLPVSIEAGKDLGSALGWLEPRKEVISSLALRLPMSSVYASSGTQGSHVYPPVYTLQLVATLAILHTVGSIAEVHGDTLVAQEALLLRSCDGGPFQPTAVSLHTLAPFIHDANPHLAWAAQTLCEAALEGVADGRVVEYIVELYTAALRPLDSAPRLPPKRQSSWHARVSAGNATPGNPWIPHSSRLPPDTVALLGFLACRRLAIVLPPILRDISISVEAFLNDPLSLGNRFVALKLCSDGFGIWQNYIDPMELLRTMFRVAWHDPAGPSEGTEARAVRVTATEVTLRIAYLNTPLFMSTLVHDMLAPRTLTDWRASMAFVKHLVQVDPGLLVNEVPRVTEAVVRALDPPSSLLSSIPPGQKDVLRAEAIQLIDVLVHTFPALTFSEATQRLAVGTLEGGVVAYDVRAVSRLYVIEAHTVGPVHLVSFSPDGRRLVSLGLNDQGGTARVWKTGTSLASVFSLGSLPRQGGDDPLGAYKAVRVHVSDAPLEAGTPLACTWIGDHSAAHLQIGSVGLSFDTT